MQQMLLRIFNIKTFAVSPKKRTFAVDFQEGIISRSGAVVARRAHNPKVVGSSPASATKLIEIQLPHCRLLAVGFF